MSVDRLLCVGRKATLFTLPVLAALPGCAKDQQDFTPTKPAATNTQEALDKTILVSTIKGDSPELIVLEKAKAAEALAKGQGIVFFYVNNPKSLNVPVVLQKMEGQTPISKKTGTMVLTEAPNQDFTFVAWFTTATCSGVFQLGYSLDNGKNYHAILVNSSPTFSFDKNCAISLNVTGIVNPTP